MADNIEQIIEQECFRDLKTTKWTYNHTMTFSDGKYDFYTCNECGIGRYRKATLKTKKQSKTD